MYGIDETDSNNIIDETIVIYLSKLITDNIRKEIDNNVQAYDNTFSQLINEYINDENLDLQFVNSKILMNDLANILFYNTKISTILANIIDNQKYLELKNNGLFYVYPPNIERILKTLDIQKVNNNDTIIVDEDKRDTLSTQLKNIGYDLTLIKDNVYTINKNNIIIEKNNINNIVIRRNRLQLNMNNITTIIDNIKNPQIKEQLQEVYSIQDDRLLDLFLNANPTIKSEYDKSQNEIEPKSKLNNIFKNINDFSSNNDNLIC